MKINMPLMKMVIRLILLLILFVVLFLISAFLYSARYWPDIYNYVNANITITRIPTLSELNLTIIEVEYATEMYSTTDIDYDLSTKFDDTTEDGVFTFDEFDFPKAKAKRHAEVEDMGKDYSEVPKKTVVVDYFFDEDVSSTKIIKDLVDESELTTRDSKDVEVMSDAQNWSGVDKLNVKASQPDASLLRDLAPWIATIFLKNATGDQFDYYCDGALVSDKAVLTAARCVNNGNGSFPAENFIVILGKTSLQITGGYEKILRVKQVKSHENFTIEGSVAKNDLALLILEEPAILNDGISVASLRFEEDEKSNISMTTAWGLSGDIALIYFDKEKSRACESNNKVENTFCATYGDEVALCPSYGGLYVTKQRDQLCLAGIRTGDPSDRGICFYKTVQYTSLANHTQWITENVEA